MLVRKPIPGLYDGVSQQSPTLRSPLQCEEQVNAWATLADGLGKRPPTEHVALVRPDAFGPATIHHINRDAAERYIVVVTDGDLRVYNHATGAPVTVNFPVGKAYLDCTNAAEEFALMTVADYTFVVNRRVACAMLPANATVDDTTYRWLNRDAAGNVQQYEGVYAPIGGAVFMGEKQRFEDLPDTASDGHVYKISGSSENKFSTYYVIRKGGVWEEHRDPTLTVNEIDARTMPHALVREGDGTFTFAPFSWAQRRVGDAKTNPEPTFIGRTINDVLFVQNRLGFLVDENVVLSATADFGNFWRNTVTTVVASDPVDVAVTGNEVSILRFALPFADSVMLFAEQSQHKLTWGDLGLTPDSVAITPVTSYKMNVRARPVKLGRDVYFCADSSAYTRVYEYYNRQADEGSSTEAADVTAHVPRYIPKGARKVTADPTNEAVFVLTDTAPRRVYVYKFAWGSPTEKVQSAWGYWEFDANATILPVEVLDEYLYLLVQRPDGVYLERLSLQSGARPTQADHQVYLDRRCVVTGTYRPLTDDTLFELPYAPVQAPLRIVRGNAAPAGVREALLDPSQYAWENAAAVKVPGNHAGFPCLIGERYVFRYVFSTPFLADGQGNILSGYTVLRGLTVYYTDTAYFATEVAPYGTSPQVEAVVPAKLAEFTGKTLGAQSLVVGSPAYHTGDYAFQVYGRAEAARVALTNDAHVASTFQSAEWEVTYHNRAR
jgi:hypothetical protein